MELYMKDSMEEEEAFQLSPLVLAYIGDAVYELFIRLYVLRKGKRQVGSLHCEAVKLVKASTQSRILENLKPFLQNREKIVIRRARNAKIDNCPSGAELKDYRQATAFEALFGYLYVSGEKERLFELIELIDPENL